MSPRTTSPACLVVFAKTPVRGGVKTRMRPFLSEEDCLRLHSLLLRLWMGRLRDWDLGPVAKTVFMTPLGCGSRRARSEAGSPRRMLPLRTQQGNDLGQRLSHALNQKWSEGFRKLVFIGTDSPTARNRRPSSCISSTE